MFSKLLQRLPGRSPWPKGIPRLYGRQDGQELATFLDESTCRRLRTLPKVMIAPRISSTRSQDLDFAAGMSHALIRNLMLVQDLSIRGPEDTYYEPKDDMLLLLGESCDVLVLVDASLKRNSLRLYIERGEDRRETIDVRSESLPELLLEASRQLTTALTGKLRLTARDAWKTGVPQRTETLVRLGSHLLEDRRLDEAALFDLWEKDPDFSTILWQLRDEAEAETLVAALELDPNNAQICFMLFCALWSGGGFEPWAMQYCRRAIELSPGHGKAHMCAPHSAPPEVDMLRHSQLGYVLLPGNSFAVNNYMIQLENAGEMSTFLELAQEAIYIDPENPAAYEQAIRACTALGEYKSALELAQHLAELYGPPMNPRTKYCIEQNPEMGDALHEGTYTPWIENAQVIRELEVLASAGEIA